MGLFIQDLLDIRYASQKNADGGPDALFVG